MKRAALLFAIGCAAGPDVTPAPPKTSPPPAPSAPADAQVAATPVVDREATWLRGSTHVHAKPSGDSSEPIESVLAWYEQHGYDFIVLTDHNRVTMPPPAKKLLVIAGTELTQNPQGCEPAGDGTCRIHVNAIGATARPEGKIAWADHHDKERALLYQRAFDEAKNLGAAIVQVNHPNWHWGMTSELLIDLAKRGARLVEIWNVQFEKWNGGDATHPSVEAEWDAALSAGERLWGVASDDAHDYDTLKKGKYPAGGGWVVVHARRDAQAILDALAAGQFYASTGVTLNRAEVENNELVVEVAPEPSRTYTITFVENGTVAATVNGPSGRRQVPQSGYLRAVITRDDGKKAWVQPVRRN
ncbi:MAG TPA: CehA/McbA family metallohydrolase [Kofleriaceae bacterium]|nr:CehA/McbA family metallohydrolase [Kofleriaceae bacterium]